MKIADYRAAITNGRPVTRSPDSEERRRLSNACPRRCSSLRRSLPSEQASDGREMLEYLISMYAVTSASALEESHFERIA